RSSLFYRSDAYREKRIASNLTRIIIVLAGVPTFSEELLNHCLIAAEDQGLKTLILLNKADMIEPAGAALNTLDLYRRLGYDVILLSAKQDVSPLLPFLKDETSVLVGQSGMGKSTLINTLIPEAKRETAEISSALDSGRHTTTHARLFHLSGDSHIIDSPGLQEFGLNHLDLERIARAFPEFRPYLGHCRFRNCRHLDEPGCALDGAMASGGISERRMAIYRKLARGFISRSAGKGRATNR
ncbi:MAG TPA: ribosome small subunit-dependent GTPase A, partial [Burkholderiales bacterium]|nr:ribosome small subunit-dependent GTPase A [Burkholderiales bacterium]